MEEDLATDLLVLQSHLDGMIELVSKNSTTSRRHRDFEMRLLSLNSHSEIIKHLLDDGKKYFDFELISLCLVDEAGEIEKLIGDEGIDCQSVTGMVLLKGKELLQSIFGFSVSPYFGAYKSHLSDFFPDVNGKPVSVAMIPLKRREKSFGTINFGSYKPDKFASSLVRDYVIHLGSVVSICLENSLNFETIKRTSYVDTLTGVNNRRCFEQRFVEELDRCQRNSDPISLLFLDIDFFKSINDKHGHQTGDQVLSLVAKAIKTQLRNNDVLARYGGEEFVALLSNINVDKAFEIAERIRKTVEALLIQYHDTLIPITVSIGLSTHLPDRTSLTRADDVSNRLIRSADAALYQAKHNGRNCVVIDGTSLAPELLDVSSDD